MPLIDIAAPPAVGNRIMDIADTNGLQPQQKRLRHNQFTVFVVSRDVDFLIIIGISLQGLLCINHKNAFASWNQFAVGAFLCRVGDSGHGPQSAVSIDILQE